MKLANAIVWLTATLFIAYGVVFAVAPAFMMEFVSGSAFGSTSAAIDARSTFGGLTIAVGVVIAILGTNDNSMPTALLAIALILGAMAITRLLGIVVDGEPNIVMYVYLLAEILGVALALVARRSIDV